MGQLADQLLALLDESETIHLAKLLLTQGFLKEEDVPGLIANEQSSGLQHRPVHKADRSSKGARMMPAVPQMAPAPAMSEPLLSLPDASGHAAARQELPQSRALQAGQEEAEQVPETSQPVHLSTFVGLVPKLQEACTSPMDPMTKLQQLPTIAEHLMSLPGVDPRQWLPTFLQMMQELLAAGPQVPARGAANPGIPPAGHGHGVLRTQHQESASISAPSDLAVSESIDEEDGAALEQWTYIGSCSTDERGEALPSTSKAVTSFIIQNLPLDFNQQQVMDFIDGFGYRDLYDVLLWFPAKKSSRRQTSSAFINFRSPELAVIFRTQFHNSKITDGDTKLNICPAIVQGFTENFVKFWHLTQKDPHSGSICCPYFASDQIEKVAEDIWSRARAMLDTSGQTRGVATEWSATTLVIRNLPDVLASQEEVVCWLDEVGHGRGYDFLLYVPKKTNPVVSQVASGAYVFVNYRSPHLAQDCFHALQHKAVDNGTTKVVLNVVISKLQGKQALSERFKDLAKSGRLVPLVDDRTSEQLEIQKTQGSQRPSSWMYQ
mmetsp:Transcript_57975/g.135693  ORF Transcript_57975/g.135693 Transcript_57975/m.135693 type:complete len:549 (+) Transcript_57975:21-1667(+)